MRPDGLAISFWASRLLVVCSCALLVYSFVVVEAPSTVLPIAQNDVMRTSTDSRLVFMVIDAFRMSFLTSSDSPMTFTRSSLTGPSSILFDAYARMPTVTLPRITAYITGTLPSFGTILTNLATEEIKVDNWISRLNSVGKKVHFFGDDTWIRLLPGKFQKSEGVTSFFVNDYTEVDNNVTRHLNEELTSNDWDALVLHYLGLDHIGHSLGGTSSKIKSKLIEMDRIIEQIYKQLLKTNKETFLIVCGDHGMTSSGSHGGSSSDETRVPVVIIKINGNGRIKKGEHIRKIEQMDVSATIFDIFGMTVPSGSYGISLFGLLQDDSISTMRKQHRHFKSIVNEKSISISDVCEEECDLTKTFIQSTLVKWFEEVQQELIGTTSDVPNFSLFVCVSILLVAIVLSLKLWKLGSICTDILIFLVNFTCFASSLIEEEHEIWFFMATTVILIRFSIQLRDFLQNRKRGNLKKLLYWIILGVFHRLSFGFLQSTRRRWSMDSSLLPPAVFPDSFDLQTEDLNTLLKNHQPLVIVTSIPLWMFFSKNFVLMFPFISHILRQFANTIFDVYFMMLFRLSILPLLYFHSTSSVILSLLLSITPVSQLPLILLIYLIGFLTSKLQLSPSELVILCTSSFFYTGNSNSLSTLSLTSAYIGLLDYFPLLVGFQLLLSTFAGPIAFLCGRTSVELGNPSEFLHIHFSFRISCLTMSLICLYIFQHHLFVWSVYSPKVVYDMAHVIFFSNAGFIK